MNITSFATFLLALAIAEASTSSCPSVIGNRTYGDARESQGDAFAELLGVACSGSCYTKASRWSQIAIDWGDVPVTSNDACRALCARTPGCQAWTRRTTSTTSRCDLLRRAATSPSLGRPASKLEQAWSGGVSSTCPTQADSGILPFPEGLAAAAAGAPGFKDMSSCYKRGYMYGDGTGACPDRAKLVAVYASQAVLDSGTINGWWKTLLHNYSTATSSSSSSPSSASSSSSSSSTSTRAKDSPACSGNPPKGTCGATERAACQAAAPCFQAGLGCNVATKKAQITGLFAGCAQATPCAPCYSDSPCFADFLCQAALGAEKLQDALGFQDTPECGPCQAAAPCYTPTAEGGGCDIASGKVQTTGALAGCAQAVVCGACFTKSKCGAAGGGGAGGNGASPAISAATAEALTGPAQLIAAGPTPTSSLTPAACAERCRTTTACAGFTLTHGVCLLRGPLRPAMCCSGPQCAPTLGKPTSAVVAADVVAGRPNGTTCLTQADIDGTGTGASGGSGGGALDDSWFDQCTTPRCSEITMSNADTFVGSTLRPPSCYHRVFNPAELTSRLADTWVVVSGGSNAILTFTALNNIFRPDEAFNAAKDGFSTGASDVVDIVWDKDGKLVYFMGKRWEELGTGPGRTNIGITKADWGPETVKTLDAALALAPFAAGGTRVTLVVGQYWPNAQISLLAAAKGRSSSAAAPGAPATSWNNARLAFYGQLSQWYLVCATAYFLCNRPDINGIGYDRTADVFKTELQSFLDATRTICAAKDVFCFVAPNCYSPAQVSPINQLRTALTDTAKAELADGTIYIADFYRLGELKPEEIVENHATTFVHVWVWQLIANKIDVVVNKTAGARPPGCPQPMVAPDSCFAASIGKSCPDCGCQDFNSRCSGATGCQTWRCANARPCRFTRADNAAALAKAAEEATQAAAASSSCVGGDLKATIDDYFVASSAWDQASPGFGDDGSDCPKNRVWCQASWSWGFGILVGLFAWVLVWIWLTVEFFAGPKHGSGPKGGAVGQRNTSSDASFPARAVGDIERHGAAAVQPVEPVEAVEVELKEGDGAAINAAGSTGSSTLVSATFGEGQIGLSIDPNDGALVIGAILQSAAHGVQPGDRVVEVAGDKITAPVAKDHVVGLIQGAARPVTIRFSRSAQPVVGGAVAVLPISGAHTSQQQPQFPKERGCLQTICCGEAPGGQGRKKLPSVERLSSLAAARLLASVHIVLGHLYQKGATAGGGFLSWGYTWVPWFFMLSGYVLTHSKLSKLATAKKFGKAEPPDVIDDPLTFLWKRTGSIFPMYALGVIVDMILYLARGLRLPAYHVLILQSFLGQSWLPWLTETSLQLHCWFLSTMVPYWLLFGVIYKCVRRLSLVATLVALVSLALLPYIALIVPAAIEEVDPLTGLDAVPFDWYKTHKTGALKTPVDYWVAMVKFNPIFYFHVFLFGMCLARFRHLVLLREEDPTATRYGGCPLGSVGGCTRMMLAVPFKFGAIFAYIVLLLIFIGLGSAGKAKAKITARISLLMPLQGLVLLGLSPLRSRLTPSAKWNTYEWGADPIANLFKLAHRRTGDISYSQYVLQFIAFALWPTAINMFDGAGWIPFFFMLLSLSTLTAIMVQAPGRRRWMKPPKKQGRWLLLVPALLAAVLLIGKAAQETALGPVSSINGDSGVKSVPPVITYYGPSGGGAFALGRAGAKSQVWSLYGRARSETGEANTRAMDVALNWTVSEESTEGAIINPTFLVVPARSSSSSPAPLMLRAARVHRKTETKGSSSYNGQSVTDITTIWHSSIIVDSTSMDKGDFGAWKRWGELSQWGLVGGNPLRVADLLTSRVKNAKWQDLCEKSPLYVPVNKTLLRKKVTGPEDPKLLLLPPTLHGPAGYDGRGAKTVPWAMSFSSLPPVELLGSSCHQTANSVTQMYLAQGGAELLGATTLGSVANRIDCGYTRVDEKNWIAFTRGDQLFFVYSIHPHTVVVVRPADGACIQRWSTSSFLPTARLATALGGQRAIHGSGTAIPFGPDRYLALLHTLKGGKYATLAYTFSSDPPFAIRSVSRPLPLQGNARAFPSGLVMVNPGEAADGSSKVVVTYGMADQQARALVLSLRALRDLFSWPDCDKIAERDWWAAAFPGLPPLCPPGQKEYVTSSGAILCLWVSSRNGNHDDCKNTICKSDNAQGAIPSGAGLVTIIDAKMNSFIMANLLPPLDNKDAALHIGLREISGEGTWTWSAGGAKLAYDNFGGRDNFGFRDEQCAAMEVGQWIRRGSWNDVPCEMQAPCLCAAAGG